MLCSYCFNKKGSYSLKQINFDMDGTLIDFYHVPSWLEYLMQEDTFPYETAEPLVDMKRLTDEINRLQLLGYEVNIISWVSKNASREYRARIRRAKVEWLRKHLPQVHFDHIHIVQYGAPKQRYASGILFDDEFDNRNKWNGIAFDEKEILNILSKISY